MAKILEGRFRFVVLLVATGCLSMMLANILTLNFTILCMTEEKFRWENFTVDLGFDVFEKVDFEKSLTVPRAESPSVGQETPSSGWPSFGDIEIPGVRVPTPGFNWQSFKLARHNPQLFLRLVKMVAFEAAERAAKRLGKAVDPRNIDFSQFRDGFNLTELNGNVLSDLKEYLLKKIGQTRDLTELAQRNVSQWHNVRAEHIELQNITWDGKIWGRVKFVEAPADYYYSSRQKALLFGVIAVGALLAIVPVGVGIDKLGCRKTFTAVGLISSICTALCPLAASLGFTPFLIVRLVQGIGFAACFPVIGAVTSAWARLTENGLFNGALTSFIQLAPVITMPLSGVLCATIGWSFSYYAHALITFIFVLFWSIFYRDTASEHKSVGIAELRLIQEGKTIDGKQKHNKAFPFKEICSDVSVWAVWVAAVANMYAIQMMIMFSPTYIKEILHYAILNVGFAAAIPTLLQFVVKMVAGICSDRLKLDETLKVRLFNSFAFCGMAIFMIILALTPPEHFRLSLLFIILCVTMLGFNTGGFFKSATLIGRHYAYFIGAKIQVIMCVSMLTVPLVVYSLTPHNSPQEWRLVFLGHASLLLVSNVIFCLIGSGKAAPFTQTELLEHNRIEVELKEPMVGGGQGKEDGNSA